MQKDWWKRAIARRNGKQESNLLWKAGSLCDSQPGKEKNLMVKNRGKASVLKGKELLLKGKTYPFYFHEKISFLFEEEDAERSSL